MEIVQSKHNDRQTCEPSVGQDEYYLFIYIYVYYAINKLMKTIYIYIQRYIYIAI